MTVRLTMAFSDNPRVAPLKEGVVKPQNIKLDCVTLDPSALFLRNLRYDAFRRSKEMAYERARCQQSTLLYFPGRDAEEQHAVFGEDPYPLGLAAMGRNIERAIAGSLEQGLLTHELRLDEVYDRTTLRT